jgi:hypothetical protein
VIKINKAISPQKLRELIRSTMSGIEAKDCFYNQFHYVNRHFIADNEDYLKDIMISALAANHPGITRDDLTYVNDFVAPVNLANGAIRPVGLLNEVNKYQWHNDTIDQWMGPCYNLWIPLYRQSALAKLDDRPLFEVMRFDDVPELYDENQFAKSNYLTDSETQPPDYLKVAAQFSGLDMASVAKSFLYYDEKGKIGVLPKSKVVSTGVVKPDMGDVYVFCAGQFHSSGPSDFERVGIAMKFLVKNPAQGFVYHDKYRYPAPMMTWEGLFTGCHTQFGDFTTFLKYLPLSIASEKVELRKNQDKLDDICAVLQEIASEIESEIGIESEYETSAQAEDDDMESGFL